MSSVKTASMRVLATVMAVCMAVVMAMGATALFAPAKAHAAINQSVLDQRSGVFKFNWGIDGVEYARGSAFLINQTTVVTAYHNVMPSSHELENYHLSQQDVLDRSTYTVTIAGDFQVPATLEKVSEKQDMAILKLDQELNNVKALKLRDSSKVEASEQVYTLGFPVTADQNAVITFTSNDVAVVDGTVTKPEGQMTYLANNLQECSGSFIMTTCRMEGGSSGGPVVDADGNVIGISVASDQSFYYAAAADILMQALDTMNYSYSKSDDPTVAAIAPTSSASGSASASASASASVSTAAGTTASASASASATTEDLSFSNLSSAISKAEAITDSSKYTPESYKKMTDALSAAKDAQKTELASGATESDVKSAQSKIDSAAEDLNKAVEGLEQAPTGPSPMVIAIIIAAVVIIAIIIIVLVMRNRKKKQEEAPTVPLTSPVGAPAPQPTLGTGTGSQTWQKPASSAAGAGTADTTMLNDEATDTVILFQAASGGSLTRMSTNEQIPINSAEFTIGRERNKVDYCLEGNTSISRVHVRIVVRDGKSYLIDNRAANGTYINGVKARPGEENLLKSGDIITLADEKFKYNA